MKQAKKKPARHTTPNGASKISSVIELLRGKDGATLEQLMNATGWQKHTLRAALTGLRKKGHTLERLIVDGTSVYRASEASK